MSSEVTMAARCEKFKGEGAEQCKALKASYTSLCPTEWVEKWDEQREAGNFPGRILSLACNMLSGDQGYHSVTKTRPPSHLIPCVLYIICVHKICTCAYAQCEPLGGQSTYLISCVVTLVARVDCIDINIIQVQRFRNFVVIGLFSIFYVACGEYISG
jgi:hypothetical protein